MSVEVELPIWRSVKTKVQLSQVQGKRWPSMIRIVHSYTHTLIQLIYIVDWLEEYTHTVDLYRWFNLTIVDLSAPISCVLTCLWCAYLLMCHPYTIPMQSVIPILSPLMEGTWFRVLFVIHVNVTNDKEATRISYKQKGSSKKIWFCIWAPNPPSRALPW